MNKTVGFWLFEEVHSKKDVASSRIRGHWLINHWDEAEVLHYGRKYEVVVYQKVYEVEHAKIFDGIKILDVCDPDYIDAKIPFMEMVELMDVVTVSTEQLRKTIQAWTKVPVVVVADRHDLDTFKGRKVHKRKAKEVCWFGYSQNSKALKSLKVYLIKYNLGISIISNEPISICEGEVDATIKERYTKWELATVNDEVMKSDFVVMPGSRDPNSRFKSNNKTINAQILGMPVATCVEELERFIDPVERRKESDKNYEMAVRDYNVLQSVQEMKELIERIKSERKSSETITPVS